MMLSHARRIKRLMVLISKGTINSFKQKFPPARIFPIAVMHREVEKTENFNSRGGGRLNCFFSPFLTMKVTVLRTFLYT